MFSSFLLFLVLSFIGAAIGSKLRLPIGTLIGAMLAVGMIKVFDLFEFSSFPGLPFMIQLLLGLMLGLTFIKIKLETIRQLGKGLAILFVGFIMMIGISAFFVYHLTGFDFKLMLLSSAPGAVVEMATLAQAYDLNSPIVVALHLVRVIVVMSLFSLLLKFILNAKVKEDERV